MSVPTIAHNYVYGRYYSPILMEFVTASSIENVDPLSLVSFERHEITDNNSITFESYHPTIATSTEYHPDPEYDPNKIKSWWTVNWAKVIRATLFITVVIITIALLINPATMELGIGMFYAGMKGAISGILVSGIIGGITNLVNGNSFWFGLTEDLIKGALDGYIVGSLMYCSSRICLFDGQCFTEGTPILTPLGTKLIEDIKEGDEVLSYNKETNETAYKKVVNVFKNKTKKWLHLLFTNDNDKCEEIICTEGHPFFVKNYGWVKAKNLFENDILLVYNNREVKLVNKELELLDHEETTYNFEVEDFHTYFVGNNNILVHNTCSSVTENLENDYDICEKGKIANAQGTGQKHHLVTNQAQKIIENKSWGKNFNRNDYIVRANTLKDHFGYEAWHRELNENIIKAVENSNSLEVFIDRLQKIYDAPDLVRRFGRIKIVI